MLTSHRRYKSSGRPRTHRHLLRSVFSFQPFYQVCSSSSLWLYCIFSVSYDVELLLCAYLSPICRLGWSVCANILPTFKSNHWVIGCLIIELWEYTLDTSSVSNIYFADTFSQSVSCSTGPCGSFKRCVYVCVPMWMCGIERERDSERLASSETPASEFSSSLLTSRITEKQYPEILPVHVSTSSCCKQGAWVPKIL